jgi:hypothetical protein
VAGALSGWLPEDFKRAEALGLHYARICNLSISSMCSIADGEAGALTWAEVAQFVIIREHYESGTSTAYASLANWPNVGRACRLRRPSWAWVADWPAYPTVAEVGMIIDTLAAVCPGTKLAAIQYRNVAAQDVDLSVVIEPAWAFRP